MHTAYSCGRAAVCCFGWQAMVARVMLACFMRVHMSVQPTIHGHVLSCYVSCYISRSITLWLHHLPWVLQLHKHCEKQEGFALLQGVYAAVWLHEFVLQAANLCIEGR
jgi:hypothetical protein